MQLFWYQSDVKDQTVAAWRYVRNILVGIPTGGGKTPTFSSIIADNSAAREISFAIAHRQELISQLCMTLARWNVEHRIIGNSALIRWIVQLQQEEFGRHWYNPNARCYAVGVDTLISQADKWHRVCESANLWVIDEAHHVLRANKWGKAVDLFPNAYGLGVTATPGRADRKGLGRQADGVFDQLILGPTPRELINEGFLTDYRIVAPPSDIDLSSVGVSSVTGDFVPQQLRQAVRRSHIVGDVVDHYIKFAQGLQGVTFATDIETAVEISNKYNARGIKSEVVTSKTKDKARVEMLKRFRNRGIQQLVNVDILGEGFDVPGIECVSMARPTESFPLFSQQFGRALRPMKGKTHALIIDHVNNVRRLGLPDAPRVWSLAGSDRRSRERHSLTKTCRHPDCLRPYDMWHRTCPFCGHYNEPIGRSDPSFVEGDLQELDLATLKRMRQEVNNVDMPAGALRAHLRKNNVNPGAAVNIERAHMSRQEAQRELREAMKLWAGMQEQMGRGESESLRRFYHEFQVDVLSAQALGRNEAYELAQKVYLSIIAYQMGVAA